MSVQISTGYITVLQAFSQMVGELCDEMQQQFIKGKLILKDTGTQGTTFQIIIPKVEQ